jgi:carbon monoxide dehydrogenase subunit G
MTLEKEISIAASAEDVWTILSDVERWYEWTPSIRSILLLDPKPLHLGSRALIEQPKLPRATWEVTEIDPGRGFVWQTRSIGALTVGEHWITPEADGRVRVTLRVRQTGVLAWVFQRWIERITREYLAIEANGLKRRCEQAKLDLLAQPA